MNEDPTPIVDWIGDVPIYHGERDDSEMCLCGHEWYMACPSWPAGGILGLTITRGPNWEERGDGRS